VLSHPASTSFNPDAPIPTLRLRFENRLASDTGPFFDQSDLGARLAYTFNFDHWSLVYG
jgi:hypothetical protein